MDLQALSPYADKISGSVIFLLLVAGTVFNHFRNKKTPHPAPDSELLISGGATIFDMKPVRDVGKGLAKLMGEADLDPERPGHPPPANLPKLLRQQDQLTMQLMKAGVALENSAAAQKQLAEIISEHLLSERQEREIEEEVERRVKERMPKPPRRRAPRKASGEG